MSEKLYAIKAWLKKSDISFAFLSHPTNVFYITGFNCDPHERLLGLFIFPNHEPFIICPFMEVSQAKASGFAGEVLGYQDHEEPWELIKSAFDKRGLLGQVKNAAIESSFLPYEKVENLKTFITTEINIASLEPVIKELRLVKNEKEIEKMRQAAEMADFAVRVGCDAIAQGQTESAIVAKIEYELAKLGFSEMAFTTMVLAGEKSAMPHGSPGDRKIKPGDFVLFDLGVVVDGYCSDITRTVAYKTVSDKQRHIYETVLKAEAEAINACTINQRLGDLDLVARNIIEAAGYGKFFPHRLGHGLGLEAHEAPSISHDNDQILTPGMVFTIEPGIYVPDIGGVRIEDDVYASESGIEVLTKFPKDLQLID